jgi:hypothetical protein
MTASLKTVLQVYALTDNTDSCMKRRLDGPRENQEENKKDCGSGEGCCFGYRLSQNRVAGDVSMRDVEEHVLQIAGELR